MASAGARPGSTSRTAAGGHQSLKTLQQRIVQVPRDACPLIDALFQTHIELLRQLPQSQLIEPQSNARSAAVHDKRNQVVW